MNVMSKFGIGQAVRRVEDQRFTTGSGQYVGDIELARQCYGVAVLSPHAHALIRNIDVSGARVAPGVVCVLTGADAATDKIGGIPPFFMPDSCQSVELCALNGIAGWNTRTRGNTLHEIDQLADLGQRCKERCIGGARPQLSGGGHVGRKRPDGSNGCHLIHRIDG